MLGQVFANGLLGRGEKIGLIFAAATDHDEYLGGGLYFDTPLGGRRHARQRPAVPLAFGAERSPVNLDDEYSRERVTFKVSRPLRQDSALTLIASGGFEADDLTIDRDGELDPRRPAAHRRSGLARLLAWHDGARSIRRTCSCARDSMASWRPDCDAGTSRSTRGAPISSSRSCRALRTAAFAERWSVRLDAFSQYTGLRAARQRAIQDRRRPPRARLRSRRDRGRPRHRRQNRAAPRSARNTESFVGRLSAYGFYDFGAAWKQDRPGRESAATAGSGIAIQGAALTGYLEVGGAAHRPGHRRQEAHLGVRGDQLPLLMIGRAAGFLDARLFGVHA